MVNAINQSRTSKMETIPEDWKMLKLSEIGTFRKGKGIARKDLIGEGIPCVLYGEIYTKYHFTAYKLSSFITQETANKAETIQSGDILFTGSGETAEEIGKSFVYLGTKKAYAGGDITILSPQNGLPLFLGYITNSTIVNKQKEMHAQGSSVIHIYPKNLEQIKIPYPPIKEQQKIATALSDMDDLIRTLEKIIAKKRKIKQRTMQQLLTGEKRLSGFDDEWIVQSVGDIGDTGRGRVISRGEISESVIGKYPVYSSQTINNGIMGYIDTFDFKGDFITWTTDGANAGKVFYRTGKFNCTNVCGVIKLKRHDYKFIALALDRVTKNHVSSNLANPKLMNDVMRKIEVKIPINLKEQQAITEIISDMDSEIEALESKLEKYKKLKEGMMQELLTGRIRLI